MGSILLPLQTISTVVALPVGVRHLPGGIPDLLDDLTQFSWAVTRWCERPCWRPAGYRWFDLSPGAGCLTSGGSPTPVHEARRCIRLSPRRQAGTSLGFSQYAPAIIK